MRTGIGFFGTYSVDAQGAFTGNRVDGATFPNWVGAQRTRQDLDLVVTGDRMMERFRRPEGTEIVIEWQRAAPPP